MNFRELAQTFDPFMDASDEVFIEIPSAIGDRVDQVALSDKIARNFIQFALTSYVKRGFPTSKETNIAIDIIAAEAYQRPRREATYSIERRIDRNQLAKTVLELARRGDMTKTLPALLALLTRTAERLGLDTKLGQWPTNEDSLGKQLSTITALLAAKGVILKRNESQRPRTWTINYSATQSDERGIEVAAAFGESATTCDFFDTCPQSEPQDCTLTDEDILAEMNGEQNECAV